MTDRPNTARARGQAAAIGETGAWPRSERQQQARVRILDAARTLFFAHGVANVSTDRLAAEAAVSKATLYRHFPGIPALLQAVVSREVDRFGYDPDDGFTDLEGLRDRLALYGERILSFLNEPDVIAFSRLMMEEARHHPDLADRFYRAAYARTIDEIAALLTKGERLGLIDLRRDPYDAAEAFLGMLEGMGLVRAHLYTTVRPYSDPRGMAARSTALFLNGIGMTR